MLFHTALAQLLHIAQHGHLVRHLHQAEILEGGTHTCGVGIVGIDDEVIVRGLSELRTVVARDIAFQSLTDGLCGHFEVTTYGNGRQGILHVVSAYEMRIYIVVHPLVLPLERQERGARTELSAHVEGIVFHTISDGFQAC